MTRELTTHLFELDGTPHADHRDPAPCGGCLCRHCPMPYRNRVHQLPDTTDEQAEHRRRAGEADQ